jgi:hypothetical protein
MFHGRTRGAPLCCLPAPNSQRENRIETTDEFVNATSIWAKASDHALGTGLKTITNRLLFGTSLAVLWSEQEKPAGNTGWLQQICDTRGALWDTTG